MKHARFGLLGLCLWAGACDDGEGDPVPGDMQAADMQAVDMQAADMQAADMRAADMQAADMQPADMGPPMDASPPADVGPPRDAAIPEDAAPLDAAPPVDAAPPDASPVDAGPVMDAEPPVDAALPVDAAIPVDAAPVDAAPVDAAPDCEDGADRPCPDDPCGNGTQICIDGAWADCAWPAEACNARDDDCDGDVDEDLPLRALFADPDGDGFHGPTIADVQPSCAAWHAAGARSDGLYRVDPDGDGAIEVFCDMTTDGGGWTRVFFHDVAAGYWAELDPLAHAVEDPTHGRYSILGRLEGFRSSDGQLDLRIDWPDTDIEGRNIWRQTSNPTTDAIEGYVAVDVDHTEQAWGGLERNRFNEAAFIDGSVGIANWFYAIASVAPWGNPPGVPAYTPSAPRVALWVRPDDAPSLIEPDTVMACGVIPGVAELGGDCAPDEAAAFPGGEEICDALDNDCNGQVDEGFEYRTWYPDRDRDGRGASAGSSCASLFADGIDADGIYRIQPAGPAGPTLDVRCDMTRDGGGWTRLFFHDVAGGYFGSNADASLRAPWDPDASLYSILTHVEAFRSSTGAFELRIEWPETPVDGRNLWRQTSDPTTAPVIGYAPLSIAYTDQFWGGLELSDRPQTFLDGSIQHPNWFYAIGAQVPWNDPPGIPSYGPQSERVALWIRPDDAIAGGEALYTCAVPEGYALDGGDCDDTDPAVAAGVEERCNGRDDDCDQAVDEGCPPGGVALTVAPQPLHFYPRDRETNRCVAAIEGTAEGAASQVRVRVTREDVAVAEVMTDAVDFTLDVPLDAGLHRYDLAVEWSDGNGFWRPAARFDDIVCGDVFLIDGQSNAVALDYHGERLGDRERNPFVRSFGSATRNANVVNDTRFGLAVADTGYVHGSIGQWGLRLANRIKDAEQIPVLVINGAVGGTRVDQHQRDDANPENPNTIYGRLLWRVRRAGVAEHVRGILWHQGESDGGLAYETYLERWRAMYEDWLRDYPSTEGVFVFQVRAGCGNPTWNRNVHRELPALLPRVLGSMSTTGVDGHDNCHFFHRTYAEWGDRMARLVRRSLYGAEFEANVDAPSPQSARWRSPTELVIDFGATGGGLVAQPGIEPRFSFSDQSVVAGVAVEGATLVVTTAAPSAAVWVSFVDAIGDIPWLVNDLGIGAFAFYAFPIGE